MASIGITNSNDFGECAHGTGEVGGSATVCNNGKIVLCLVVDAGSSTREA